MSRDGSGTYSLPAGQPVVTGTTISSTTFNTLTSDLATAITASIANDGQTPILANLPMSGYRHTGVDDSAARTDYASAADVQDGRLTYLTSVSGTNTITATAANSMAAYATGQRFIFLPAAANTGSTTLNINAIGAKNVTQRNGAALVGGEWGTGTAVEVVYDGTQFQLMGTSAKAIYSGYTRVTPNYCRRSSLVALPSASADVTRSTNGNFTVALPTGASGAELLVYPNCSANHYGGLTSYWDSGRSNIADQRYWNSSAGLIDMTTIFVPSVSGTGYLTLTADVSGDLTIEANISAYYD